MLPTLFAVLPRPPHPTRDGSAIRNYHLLAGLAREFGVRAFVLRAPHLPPGEYPPGVDPSEIPQTPRAWRRAVAAAASLAGGGPYPPRLYASRALSRALSEALRGGAPAWVASLSYHTAPAALAAGRAWIDFQNLDSRIWARTAASGSSSAVRAFASLQARRVREFESRVLSAAGGVSCVSAGDAAAMRELSASCRPLVVPNGVDMARYEFRPDASAESLLFFVGDLSWPPNAEGVRWFRDRVWPIVRREAPEAVVEILGREPPARLSSLSDPRFRVLGEGGDTRPFWRRAAVSIVPLLAAGGTRLKILEAAAAGVPVVSTCVGAEGLELAPGAEITVADEPEAFAAAVVRLLSDRAGARRQALAARARVERSYAWSAIASAFAAELARRGAAA
jgi:glycosyltransferase involved in cell wall biosynthesis